MIMYQNEVEQDVIDPNHVILVDVTRKAGNVSQISNDGRLSLKFFFLFFDFLLVLFIEIVIDQESVSDSSEEAKHEEPTELITSLTMHRLLFDSCDSDHGN